MTGVGDTETDGLADDIRAISRMISHSYPAHIQNDPEVHGWRRIMKVAEEVGEVTEAWLGYLGENPRKGRTHDLDGVLMELLDVAGAALGAYEHLIDNEGRSLTALAERLAYVRSRLELAVSRV